MEIIFFYSNNSMSISLLMYKIEIRKNDINIKKCKYKVNFCFKDLEEKIFDEGNF